MSGNGTPIVIRARHLDSIDACPASAGSGSKLQRAALDRWKATNSALESILVHREDVDKAIADNTGWLDPIQAFIVSAHVRSGVSLLDDSSVAYDFNPDDRDSLVVSPNSGSLLAAYRGLAATHADGTVEHLKLRTGRRGTPDSEAAILLDDNDKGELYADVMVESGALEPIELSDEQRDVELARLFELTARPEDLKDRRPGWGCYQCSCVATCGQYPPAPGFRIGRWQRTILLTKTELLTLNQCHRRVAWKRLHTMPKEASGEPSLAAATGTRFHDLLAEVLCEDDPDAEFADQLERIAPDQHARMKELYERHKVIEADHISVDYKLTEYNVGVTLITDGIELDSHGNTTPDRPIAVTIIARADAVGRELDGTPAIVEHRTGSNSDRIDERETGLYALSVARLLNVDSVSVHQHALDAVDGPRCERMVYDRKSLASAEALLTTAVGLVANWNPVDSREPSFTVGEWCPTCSYATRCAQNRTVG